MNTFFQIHGMNIVVASTSSLISGGVHVTLTTHKNVGK